MRQIVFLLLVFLFSFPARAWAIYDPLTRPNNQYGIHVADTADFGGVSSLVNSNGGDWGYITIVIPETDRNSKKWQEVFDDLRKLRLIPIVRLAAKPVNSHWQIPDKNSLQDWVVFLNSLNWPVENRYITLFNEPNHAKEWGNIIDPENYAQISLNLIRELKHASPDFFIMLAGFDVSARSDMYSLDAKEYIERIFKAQPELKELIDGWSSHSYPNPGFAGSPYATGRGTLRSYLWELELLKKIGITKTLPIFITETGWQHKEGKFRAFNLPDENTVGEYIKIANQNVWNDKRIVAVTPFIYNYQDEPFDHFSWRRVGTDGYYKFVETFRGLSKTAGQPSQHESYQVAPQLIPNNLIVNSSYTLNTKIRNLGQAILWSDQHYSLVTESSPAGFSIHVPAQKKIEPGAQKELFVQLNTPEIPGKYDVKLILGHYDKKIILEEHQVELLPPPALNIQMQLGWRYLNNSENITVIVYSPKEEILHKFENLTLKNGELKIPNLTKVVPDQTYRIVALVPYYLPRQTHVKITLPETNVHFRRFLPLDFNDDGRLSIEDLQTLFVWQPQSAFNLFFGN